MRYQLRTTIAYIGAVCSKIMNKLGVLRLILSWSAGATARKDSNRNSLACLSGRHFETLKASPVDWPKTITWVGIDAFWAIYQTEIVQR